MPAPSWPLASDRGGWEGLAAVREEGAQRRAGLRRPDQGEHRGRAMSSIGTDASRPACTAAMDADRMATPSPRMARSATAPGALASSAMSGRSPAAAQPWSNTARTPVPSGRLTTGYAATSASAVRGWLASG